MDERPEFGGEHGVARANAAALELFVADLERSVAWYVEVLGFGRVRADPSYASVQRGDWCSGWG